MRSAPPTIAQDLAADLLDARKRTLELVSDLDDEQLLGPRLAIVNPMRWEIGHLAWFQEKWLLRELRGEKPIRPDADALYDSFQVAHDTRLDLPLPSREGTLAYMQAVLDRALERLSACEPDERTIYFYRMVTGHEDMHDEAFTYTRQTLGYPPPTFAARAAASLEDGSPSAAGRGAGRESGDSSIPGGTFLLGARRDAPFVWDNEKWEHPVDVAPFRISREAVSQGELAAFADAGGYSRREWWTDAGWAWREREGTTTPAYWKKDAGSAWLRRRFDAWVRLERDAAAIHVNRFEAEAFCRWAGRRLPTEAEWEIAASAAPGGGGAIGPVKRVYPWGEAPPAGGRANLDGQAGGTVARSAHAAGDSPFGCRQMIGNVWEWTSDDFLPYPGFVVDPYKEYSEPWFGDSKVLRGGCWATRSRLIRNTWRNFYTPDRRDVFAGFRTCALGSA